MKETDKLKSKPLDQWPTHTATIKKVASKGEEKVFQCQEITKYSEAQAYYERHFQDYCSKVTDCIRSQMAWSDLQLMRDIVFVLGTQGWEKAVEENDSMEAINRLVERFTVPL